MNRNLYIIDSGIPEEYKLQQEAFIINKKGRIKHLNNDNICFGIHGEIIFKIIKNILINDFKVISMRIYDENLNASFYQLYAALLRILRIGKPSIINLSLAIFKDIYNNELQIIINELIKKNIFIVCSATLEKSYPSDLKNVITVVDNSKSYTDKNFDFKIDIKSYNYEFVPESSTSYACPIVSAKAYEIMNNCKQISFDILKQKLYECFKGDRLCLNRPGLINKN
jgi:hypothetical protein